MNISARRIIAVRDALIRDEPQEAYHHLRMAVDGDNQTFLRTGEHWTAAEVEAESEPALTE